jgi:hypothetical protein
MFEGAEIRAEKLRPDQEHHGGEERNLGSGANLKKPQRPR